MNNWIEVKDGDPRAVAIYRRHYSCRNPKADLVRYGFSGKGESMILLTVKCDALFCWRRVVGEGIVCSVFHNEGGILSSDLIREACTLAQARGGEERLYTYVNPKKLNKSGDGNCFKKAGWKKLKAKTKKDSLIILESSCHGRKR